MITGSQLRILRLAMRYTGQQMADYMHVTKQTISSIETGRTTTISSRNYYRLVLLERINMLDDEDYEKMIALYDLFK